MLVLKTQNISETSVTSDARLEICVWYVDPQKSLGQWRALFSSQNSLAYDIRVKKPRIFRGNSHVIVHVYGR